MLPRLCRILVRILLVSPVLLWLCLSILGSVDTRATARLFSAAGSAVHDVIAEL
jgi:hypothetical protein